MGDAGVLFDPEILADLTAKFKMVLCDSELRQTLIKKGLERSKLFAWERCAEETLAVFEECFSKP